MMSLGQPKLRRDLVVSQQQSATGTSFVVKDPVTGRFFGLGEAEGYIVQQLDGVTPLEEIRQRVSEEYAATLTQHSLARFIENLQKLGLLEHERAGFDQPSHPHGSVRGTLLYLRVKAFDPDRILDQLIGKTRFLFTRSFLAFSAGLIVLAVGITIVNWGEIAHDLLRLYRFQALLLAWLTVLFVTSAHEFAHGLTCKYFGGQVHEMGFLLLYFQPALYCNVSDAWLFPEKPKRLWVTFAGAYFELFLWALATLAWRITDPGTALNYAALVVMASSAIKAVFNFNPLIKLDGYYLLSDYLEIPNLRQRALHHLALRFRRLRGLGGDEINDATPRERRIYLTYGFVAGAYSFSLLGFIVLRLGSFLTERYQGLGFVIFSGLLIAAFRNPLQRAIPKLPTWFQRAQASFPYLNRRKKILIVAGIVLGLFFLGRMELKVAGQFRILPAENADLRAEIDGMIEEIYVDTGTVIRKGDPVARLSARDMAAELQKTDAEINEQRAKIELATQQLDTARTRQQYASHSYEEARRIHAGQLSKSSSSVEKAEERLKYAKMQLERTRTLFLNGLTSKKEIDEAAEQLAIREKELEEARAEKKMVLSDELAANRQALAVAEKELQEAKGRLKMLLAGSRPEETQETEPEISRLEVQQRYLNDQLRRVNLVSPISGVVTTQRLKEKIGQHVSKGDLVAQVNELRTVKAEIAIPEKEVGDIEVGEPVVVKARAYPEKSFHGVVTAIAPTATKEDADASGKAVLVTTQLDNEPPLLKPEMTGTAKIYCGKRSILHLVTRRFTRYVRVEFWSWW